MTAEDQPYLRERPPTHVLVGTSDGEKLVGEEYITLEAFLLLLTQAASRGGLGLTGPAGPTGPMGPQGRTGPMGPPGRGVGPSGRSGGI